MQSFEKEFRTIEYIISKSDRVLFVAHSRPDPDAVGSNSALAEYVRMRGKHADIACLDPFPEALSPLLSEQFFHPDQLDLGSYDAVIACDSVDRGFDKIVGRFSEDQAVVRVPVAAQDAVTDWLMGRGAAGVQEDYPGLYPAGEGAGYAGGIMSAGVDGIEAAEALAAQWLSQPRPASP